MPATYEPIASTTLSAATSTITFSDIPQTYTDLVLVISSITNVDSSSSRIRFNNDSNTLYSGAAFEGTGSSVFFPRQSNANAIGLESNIGTDNVSPSIFIINIFNYSNTTTNKTVLLRQNGFFTGGEGVAARIGLYRSSSAINRIDILETANNYGAGSVFTIYGIKAA